jgi:hypothetical protein
LHIATPSPTMSLVTVSLCLLQKLQVSRLSDVFMYYLFWFVNVVPLVLVRWR